MDIDARRKRAFHGAIGKLNSHDGHALRSSENGRVHACQRWLDPKELKSHGIAIVLSEDKLTAEVKSFDIKAASPLAAAPVRTRTVSVDFQTAPAVYRRLSPAVEEIYAEMKAIEAGG